MDNTRKKERAWTSRRRLETALACGVPDRVPINTYGMVGYDSKRWMNRSPSYARLMQYVREQTDCIAGWSPTIQANNAFAAYSFATGAVLDVEEHRRQQDDWTSTTYICHSPRGDLRCVLKEHTRVHTSKVVEPWCKSIEDVDKVLSLPYEPIKYDASDYSRIAGEVGENGLIMASYSDPGYQAAALMSFQDFTLWAFQHSEHFARAVCVYAERMLKNFKNFLDAVVLDMYRIVGAEYFTPPYLPPSLFERFGMPHIRSMNELIHNHGAKSRLHCHGKIAKVLDFFFETGCDAIDPAEPPPDGDIELDQVKRRCADHGVCVFGNIELHLLECGKTPQVRQTVRRALEQAKDGGGFVLMPTAEPIDEPLKPRTEQNYMTMIETALEFGTY